MRCKSGSLRQLAGASAFLLAFTVHPAFSATVFFAEHVHAGLYPEKAESLNLRPPFRKSRGFPAGMKQRSLMSARSTLWALAGSGSALAELAAQLLLNELPAGRLFAPITGKVASGFPPWRTSSKSWARPRSIKVRRS